MSNTTELRRKEENDLERLLFTAEDLAEMNARLGARISADFAPLIAAGKKLIFVPILKGSIMFAADLARALTVPAELEFMKVSSYGAAAKTSGEIKINLDLNRDDLEDAIVLIVEDIVDSGRTLSRLTQMLSHRGAYKVSTVTMLDKPCRREVAFTPDYVGFTIPDGFVVGYGLDFDQKYRTLPYIGILKPEIYS